MGFVDKLGGLGAVTGGLQALGGLVQTFTSGVKKKERALENFANSYQKNEGILDYYNKALAKYSANPYSSQSYGNSINKIQRNLATGINATQDKRGGLATITGLVTGANDADANAASRAEQQQNAALNTLGNATQMKAREDYKPFEMKYNLLAAKAGAAAMQKRNGMQNIFGGLSNIAAGIGGMGGSQKSTNGISGAGLGSTIPYNTYDYTGTRDNQNFG